ncbi:hypothetical protein ABIE08_004553 [Kaistia defluvii]|uniref:Uncharacterized protein n=1 Tax=Kaistia defluvii TaxID=410841 RepID=A0ABV2R5N4_9HYPH
MVEPAVETLRDAYRAGWTAKARCLGRDASTKKGTRPCLQTVELDLGTLVWTRGRDFPLARLPERLMCPACGCRRVMVTFDMPGKGFRALLTG